MLTKRASRMKRVASLSYKHHLTCDGLILNLRKLFVQIEVLGNLH